MCPSPVQPNAVDLRALPPRKPAEDDPPKRQTPPLPVVSPTWATDSLTLSGPRIKETSERVLAEQESARILGSLVPKLDALDRDKYALDSAFAPKKPLPLNDRPFFAIQSIRFADRLQGGREQQMQFEKNPGDLVPPIMMPPFVLTDPRTGQANLALRQARVRMSSGEYDLYLTLDGEGKPRLDRLYKNGRRVESLMLDTLKDKIMEDPAIWGPIAGIAAAGVVVLAERHVAKTGDPLTFDAASVKLIEREGLTVKGKIKAELTGTSSLVRASGAELGMNYHDGPLEASGGIRYLTKGGRREESSWQATAGARYAPNRSTTVYASAFVDPQRKDYGAFVGLSMSLP